MRTLTKSTKKVLTWVDFRDSLIRAGFSNRKNHPAWLYTKGDDDLILAIPGNEDKNPLVGMDAFNGEIHNVWFSSREVKNQGTPQASVKYTSSPIFPASILS